MKSNIRDAKRLELFKELFEKYCGMEPTFDEMQDDSDFFWFNAGLDEANREIKDLKLELKAAADFMEVCNI